MHVRFLCVFVCMHAIPALVGMYVCMYVFVYEFSNKAYVLAYCYEAPVVYGHLVAMVHIFQFMILWIFNVCMQAVMISHDNIIWTARAIAKALGMGEKEGEVGISYLPLRYRIVVVIKVINKRSSRISRLSCICNTG
jgi:hypothetical protein